MASRGRIHSTAIILFVLTLLRTGMADYDCICNYNIEKPVFSTPSTVDDSTIIGYMYEFDCKPAAAPDLQLEKYYAVQFQKKLGYVEKDLQVETQTCPGQPLIDDVIAKNDTSAKTTTTSKSTSTSKPITSTSKPMTSSKATVPTSKPTTTSIKTSEIPTTKTTTEIPTTKTTTEMPTTRTTTEIPTTKTTTEMPTTKTTTEMPTTRTTTEIPTPKPTTIKTVPTTLSTTELPTTKTTMTMPTTQTTTTTIPITKSTTMRTTSTQQPTTKSTTQKSTTSTMRPTTSMTSTSSKMTSSPTPMTYTPTQMTSTPTTTLTGPVSMESTTVTMPSSSMSTVMSTSRTTLSPYWLREANVSGTAFQYVGIGYNLLNGNPISSPDPGLLLDRRVLQLSTSNTRAIEEATFTQYNHCHSTLYNDLVHGSKSLQHEMNVFVNASDDHQHELTDSAFIFNPHFMMTRKGLDSGDHVFQDHVSTCTRGTVTYDNELANKKQFTVSRDFAMAVCSLSPRMNSTTVTDYLQFLDNWGTSVVMSADIGSRNLTRYSLTRLELFHHVQGRSNKLVTHGGPIEGYGTSLAIDHDAYVSSARARDTFNSPRHLDIGPTDDHVVAVDIDPISNFINWTYFNPIMSELISEDVCPDSMDSASIQTIGQNMAAALNQYPAYRNTGSIVSQVTNYPLRIPVTWPAGTYGLLKTRHGCPGDKVTWYSGWRQYDTEDSSANNYFTNNIANYLYGTFNDNIRTEFCMKTTGQYSKYDTNWPKGAYCLMKKGGCPSRFYEGYIYWDDEDLNNGNHYGGILPDGTYNSNTKMYYCCRSDGPTSTKITLPTQHPFVLVRFGLSCQSVFGMTVRDLFVRWDDNDLFNSDDRGGMHPYDNGGSKDHLLHFCYYEADGSSGGHVIG